MKRSEMIESIASEICAQTPEINWSRAQIVAEVILKRIEIDGMKPPTYRFEDGDLGTKFVTGWESEKSLSSLHRPKGKKK